MVKLERNFYTQDTVSAAQAILGKVLASRVDGEVLMGRIVETEAYLSDDPACHGSRGRTPRSETMFGDPGHAYVYLTYGLHYCLGLVTQPPGVPEVIFIRALEPLQGLDTMRRNRGVERVKDLCSGPGKLTQALGIDRSFNGEDLLGDRLYVLDDGQSADEVIIRPRVGISEAVDMPWRFYSTRWRDWVSKR